MRLWLKPIDEQSPYRLGPRFPVMIGRPVVRIDVPVKVCRELGGRPSS